MWIFGHESFMDVGAVVENVHRIRDVWKVLDNEAVISNRYLKVFILKFDIVVEPINPSLTSERHLKLISPQSEPFIRFD